MRALRLLVLFALLAGAAQAQERSPVQRQTLTDLAYVLGEAHALRQVCAGAGDQYWRNRMIRLVDTEQPDATFEARLREAFNTGFALRQGQFRSCGPAVRAALSDTLQEGQRLSVRLSDATVAPPPDSMAAPATPR